MHHDTNPDLYCVYYICSLYVFVVSNLCDLISRRKQNRQKREDNNDIVKLLLDFFLQAWQINLSNAPVNVNLPVWI